MIAKTIVSCLTFSIAILLFGVKAAPCIHIVGNIGMKNFYTTGKELTWFEAMEYCHHHGMSLASIESIEEQAVIEKYLRNLSNKHLWIAATDFFNEGTFSWMSTAQRLNFSNWLAGQPDGGLNRNCVLINGITKKWEDQLCSFKYCRPLCQIIS